MWKNSSIWLSLLCVIGGASGIPQSALDANLPLSSNAVNARKQVLFACPEEFGTFPDDLQCDKFWICENGAAKADYCEDGLVFDPFKAKGREPCDSPYVVDCGTRTELQEPTFPNKHCPRAHGYFADPDPTVCDVFYNCIKGNANRNPCAPGLHFDETAGNCQWPHLAGRSGCAVKKAATVNGFTCPEEEVLNDQGLKMPHPNYPNAEDCQKFYVCLNGKTPQEAACNLGQVFNEKAMVCDYPENVPECVGWYKNDPRFADYYDDTVGGNAAADPGKQDVIG